MTYLEEAYQLHMSTETDLYPYYHLVHDALFYIMVLSGHWPTKEDIEGIFD